jgi:hypothetical protein
MGPNWTMEPVSGNLAHFKGEYHFEEISTKVVNLLKDLKIEHPANIIPLMNVQNSLRFVRDGDNWPIMSNWTGARVDVEIIFVPVAEMPVFIIQKDEAKSIRHME